MKILATAFVMVTFAAGAVTAGEPPTLGIGSRVRILQQGAGKKGPWLIGVIAATDSETMTLSLERGDTRVVPWSEVRKIEVSRGRRSVGDGMLRGAGIGLLAGVAAGGLLAIGEKDDGCPSDGGQSGLGFFNGPLCFGFTAADKRSMAVAGMGLVGTSLGAVMGGAARGERWQRAGERHTRLSPTSDAHGRGAGLALSVSF